MTCRSHGTRTVEVKKEKKFDFVSEYGRSLIEESKNKLIGKKMM